jgi:hypothetical protein
LRNTILEYAIRKVQGNQVGLKLNGTHQVLLYANDVNLLRDNTVKDLLKAFLGNDLVNMSQCTNIISRC